MTTAAIRVPRAILRLFANWRGGVAIVAFVLVWQILGALSSTFGGKVPTPIEVTETFFASFVNDPRYWQNWAASFERVLWGFGFAQLFGIPLGIALGLSRTTEEIVFPVFEVLRPIPPLAWVPASIIFWPTQELAIMFITFLGAFYTIVINVVGGAKSIDVRYFHAAQSMGASRWDIFRRIVLPGTLPSIVVGSAVGMGITWEVVVAAEMISGGGSQMGGSGGGLGFFIWNSYVGGSYEQIVVGMISIGIAGFFSSELLRGFGSLLTPWLKVR